MENIGKGEETRLVWDLRQSLELHMLFLNEQGHNTIPIIIVISSMTSNLTDLKNGNIGQKPGDKKFNKVCIHGSRTEQVSEITITPALYHHTI